MSVLEIAGNFRCRYQQINELIYGESGLGDLAWEIILQGTDLFENLVSELPLERLHRCYPSKGTGRRLYARLVIDVEHGSEEAYQKLHCIYVRDKSWEV